MKAESKTLDLDHIDLSGLRSIGPIRDRLFAAKTSLGDSLGTIRKQIGFEILSNRCSGIRFGQPDFTPSFELVDEQARYYDMVFIISDDGYPFQLRNTPTGEPLGAVTINQNRRSRAAGVPTVAALFTGWPEKA